MAENWLEQMVEEIRTKQAAIDNQKKAANTFFREKGEAEPFVIDDPDAATTSMRIKPDAFYGKIFTTAAREYLERRKTAATHDDVLHALDRGGFDFDAIGWKQENRARTVAMALAKNSAIFHRLPNGMFGLKKWYGDAIEKKKARRGDASAEEETSE